MTVALLVHTAAGSSGGGNVTTSAIDTTGASLIVAMASSSSPTPVTGVSDSASNTWTSVTAVATGDAEGQFFYCSTPVTSASHTFTASRGGGSSFPSIAVAAFSGAAGTPDISTGAAGNGTSAPSTAFTNTPAFNNEVILTGLSMDMAGVVIVNDGFTITDQVALSAGNSLGVALAYLIQTTAAALNLQWSGVFSSPAATLISFQQSSAAAVNSGFLAIL